MNQLLKDKVAIITGGGRGIGRAIAERFAQEGCNLMLAARTKSELQDTSKYLTVKYHVNVITHQTNIGIEPEINAMVNKTATEFGKINILVNNAAIIGPMGEITDIDYDEFFNTFRINVGGTIYCTNAVLPYMKENNSGCIINLSGGGALYPLPYYDAYAVSKTSIVRLTENFAIEFKKYNIGVTAIAPGAVNTRMFDEQLKANKNSIGEQNWQDLQKRLASGGDSIEKAPELALYIASKYRPELNGKVISAIWDNWNKISKNADKIADSDIYNMRRIIPKDRNIEL
jgi:3-oxoacyl-[acyl-carrier protein] reductase